MFEAFKKVVLVPVLCWGLIAPTSVLAEEPTPQPQLSLDLNLEVPSFTYSLLKDGQKLTATRDIYLLTPESFARITTEFEFMKRRYEIHLSERIRLSNLEHTFRADLLKNQNLFLETELKRTNNLLIEIQESRRQDLTPLWVAVSFVAGCALTVGLVYALQPGME